MGAYKFDAAVEEAIYVGTSPVTAYPCTIGVVFMADISTATGTIAGLYNSTDDTRYHIIQYVSADDVTLRVASGGTGNSAISLGAGADDVWQTGVGVSTSATARAAFRAGGNKGTTTTNRTWPTGLNKIGVGRFTAIAPAESFTGWIAYVFIWNVALSDAEVADFNAGILPQSSALVAAYDFTTDQGSTIVDQIGTRDLTVTGATYDASVTPSPTFSFGPTTHFGATSLSITFGKDVRGQRKAFGQIVRPFTFASVIEGRRKALGQLAFPITFSKEISAQRKTFGQLLSPFIFGKAVAGRRTTFGQIGLPITIAIATAGLRPGITLYGSLALSVTFEKDVRGQRKTFGQVAMPLVFAREIQGQRKTFGQISLPIIFTKEAVGRKNVFGQLSMQTLFGKEIAGRRQTFSQLAMPLAFSKAVSGHKQTFGRIALPLTFEAFVDGQAFVGPKTHYGQLAMPLAFGKQVIGQRKTFGQITAPFIFGSASQGQRRTFSTFELPIDFEAMIKSGRVDVHGVLDMDLVLTIDVKGNIKLFGIILNDAFNLYLGDQDVLAAYVGSQKVWP